MEIEDIKLRALEMIERAKTKEDFETIRIQFLGRKGELTSILRTLSEKSIEEKRIIGSKANELRKELEDLLSGKLSAYENLEEHEHKIDLSKPGKKIARGHIHPLSKIEEEIKKIFISMNFSVVEGPEAESEYYNFDALNIPADHPARDMWDTFWLNKKMNVHGKDTNVLMRTHTSPVQVRYMEHHVPPFQIIVPGRTFRYEATDASHEVNFHQIEGLMIGKDITFANLKYVIETFLKQLFPGKLEFRFRPSYFPFVEPGIEVDIKLKGKWMEVMGAGMVHRNVLIAAKYNPEEVQGFAFGFGMERLAMIKYGIPDIRLFYTSDARFTKQF